jgi:HSP20 family protein
MQQEIFMANENPSRQQTADRSQSPGSAQQRTGQSGMQPGSASQDAQASAGQYSGATSRQGGSYGEAGRQGTSQSRYGSPARRASSSPYDVSPYSSYGGSQSGGGAGPFSLMRRISDEMDRLFDTFGMGRNFLPEEMTQGRSGRQSGASLWSPHLEVCERNGKLLIQADLPGVRREDVNVQIEPEAIILQGERKQENEHAGQGYYHSERSYGSFYRVIPLPEGSDTEQATATFRNGVLEVEVPMSQQQQRARQLQIQDAGSDTAGSMGGPGSSAAGSSTAGSSSAGSSSAGSSSAGSGGGSAHGSNQSSGASGGSRGTPSAGTGVSGGPGTTATGSSGASGMAGGQAGSSIGGQHSSGGTR